MDPVDTFAFAAQFGRSTLTRCDAISPPTYATRAVTDQLGRLHHVSNLYYTAEQGKLGEWLVKNSVADKCVPCPFLCCLCGRRISMCVQILADWDRVPTDAFTSPKQQKGLLLQLRRGGERGGHQAHAQARAREAGH